MKGTGRYIIFEIVVRGQTMLSEGKKKAITLTLFWIAITINVLPEIFIILPKSTFRDLLFNTGLTRWGWLPAFVFLTATITFTILWKPCTPIMRTLLVLFSLIMLIWDLIWLFAMLLITSPGIWA